MQVSISNNKLTNYLRESYHELRKVVWPTKQETTKLTLVVICISLSVAIFLGALDLLFTWVLEKYI